MAENGRETHEQIKATADKEIRLRQLKERQNDERQKKLEEIKAQALAAQRFKEQKETERRKRLEDLRVKDDIRRLQVEERKRAINDAERDRLESILRRNQEREARIESRKRNERSNIVFAFGSSTPRMLEPADMSVSFWGHRRATSTQNIPSSSSSLTRRQSERDLDTGNKKRATSASGLERSGESNLPTTPAGCASGYIGRRRTDLMPTVPSRDSSFTSSRKSLNHSPGRAYSMSRLDQLAKPRKRSDLAALTESASRPLSSSSRISTVTRSMSHLAVSKQATSQSKRPLSKADSRSMHQLGVPEGSLGAPRTTRATQLRQQKLLAASSNCSEASSRPSSSLSQQSTNSITSSVNIRHRSTPRRPRPASIAVTGVSIAEKGDKPPIPKPRRTPKSSEKSQINKNKAKSPVDSVTPRSLPSPSSTTKVVEENKVLDNEDKLQKPPDVAPESRNIVAPSEVKEDKLLVIEETPKPEVSPKAAETANVENLIDIPEIVSEVLKTEPIVKETITKIQLEKPLVPIIAENTIPVQAAVYQNDPEPVLTSQSDAPPIQINQSNGVEALTTESSVLLVSTTQSSVAPVSTTQNSVAPALITESTSQPVPTNQDISVPVPVQSNLASPSANQSNSTELNITNDNANDTLTNSEMSTSMSKPRITTEEEAKAALAERRRLAREEAERQAEMERLRIETEQREELERQRREEEQVRQLVEMQRQAEQERLQEAIRDTQRRDEEERLRKEEELKLKQLKEEAEKKAKEEAEKQKAELQEKLKNEEKERELRRKRVEAIMLRTRGKNNANLSLQQNSEDKNENKSENTPVDENKVNENKMNGTKQENGTTESSKKEKDVVIVDNIIPDETIKNGNNVTETITATDSINSNNTWQSSQQYDSLT